MTEVDVDSVLAFRARASYLDQKLPEGSFAEAAFCGLQDSAPRAGVISLHARVEGVEHDSWGTPSLVQIWGPRGADYIVPRKDVAIFTLGRSPRDPDQFKVWNDIADQVEDALDGETLFSREVAAKLPELGHMIRCAALTGRLHIKWDASKIWLIPVEAPDIDPEEARLELARRFLRCFGPSIKTRFEWWAGIETKDANETWAAVKNETVDVSIGRSKRVLLESDLEALEQAEPIEGVRLIPHGDPLIKMDADFCVSDPQLRLEIFPEPTLKPSFWPVAGAVLVDGQIVGSWARQQGRVTVNRWTRLAPTLEEKIEKEALAFPINAPKKQVLWHEANL